MHKDSLTTGPSNNVEVVIPALYTEVLQHLSDKSLEFAKLVEAVTGDTNHRFGMRVFMHNHDLAEAALECGQSRNMSPNQIGLLMVGCFAEDIGRSIAALPYEQRITWVPEDKRDDTWADNHRAQHRHGELGVFVLQKLNLLDGLSSNEQQIVLDMVYHHCTPNLELNFDSPSYAFCQIGRELDQSALLVRRDFMTAQGALDQFLQWGLEFKGLEKNEVKKVLDGAPEINLAVSNYLTGLLQDRSRGGSTAMIQACSLNPAATKIALALIYWFELPSPYSIIKRGLDWANGETKELPVIVKTKDSDEMIDCYCNYMLAHAYTAIRLVASSQASTTSVPGSILNGESITDRLNFVRSLIGDQAYNENIQPAIDYAVDLYKSR